MIVVLTMRAPLRYDLLILCHPALFWSMAWKGWPPPRGKARAISDLLVGICREAVEGEPDRGRKELRPHGQDAQPRPGGPRKDGPGPGGGGQALAEDRARGRRFRRGGLLVRPRGPQAVGAFGAGGGFPSPARSDDPPALM